jgi:hypothetical protein
MATQQPSERILAVDGDCRPGAAGVRNHGGGAIAVDLESANWLVADLEHDPPRKPFKSGCATAYIPPVHVDDCPDHGRAFCAKRLMTEALHLQRPQRYRSRRPGRHFACLAPETPLVRSRRPRGHGKSAIRGSPDADCLFPRAVFWRTFIWRKGSLYGAWQYSWRRYAEAKILINASGQTGVYYDERGRPMQGSALVRDAAFQDRVVAETRALLSTVPV